jgi:hypothetical protein
MEMTAGCQRRATTIVNVDDGSYSLIGGRLELRPRFARGAGELRRPFSFASAEHR